MRAQSVSTAAAAAVAAQSLMAAIGNTQLSLSPVRILGDNYPKCKWQRKVVCFLPAIQRGKGREGGEGALSPISKYEFPHTRFCGSHHYRTLPPPPPLPPQYRQTLYSTGILYSDRGVAVRPVCVCVFIYPIQERHSDSTTTTSCKF